MAKSKKGRKRTRGRRRRRKIRRLRHLKTPLPNKLLVKMKYYDTFNLDPAAAAIGTYVFNPTSLFDPNTTGIGHQPRGFDQIMSMYTNYTVIHCKITLQPIQGCAVSGCQFGLVLQPNATPATIGGGAEPAGINIAEYKGAIFKSMPEVVTSGAWVNSRFPMLKKTYSPGKFLSITKPLSDDSLKGTKTASPAADAYFMCYYWSETGSNPPNVFFKAMLTYTAVLTEPVMPAAS